MKSVEKVWSFSNAFHDVFKMLIQTGFQSGHETLAELLLMLSQILLLLLPLYLYVRVQC